MRKSLTAALAFICVMANAAAAHATETVVIQAKAKGQIIYQAPCDPNVLTVICQQTVISGTVTHVGKITGVLAERVNILNGTYTGTAVFTTPNGDTLETQYVGLVSRPDASGAVRFLEWHTMTAGTGRFENATGNLFVLGSASGTGAIAIEGIGELTR